MSDLFNFIENCLSKALHVQVSLCPCVLCILYLPAFDWSRQRGTGHSHVFICCQSQLTRKKVPLELLIVPDGDILAGSLAVKVSIQFHSINTLLHNQLLFIKAFLDPKLFSINNFLALSTKMSHRNYLVLKHTNGYGCPI